MMRKPAQYPPTDASEQKSVTTFLNHIDNEVVKADIKTRDKFPNIDGVVELVDNNQVPIGKLEVQIKTISKGENKYSCPTSLVAYSEVTTLPILLICVDIYNEVIFWRHITLTMPEFKEDQDSFTIHFSKENDVIDNRLIYIQKWIEITRDYQKRIMKYPILSLETIHQAGLEEIDQSDHILFQRFLDALNGLFDHDFLIVKKILYPGIWKFGIGINIEKTEPLHYQLYKIPYGKTDPLISVIESKSFFDKGFKLNVISEHLTNREYLSVPEERAKELVFEDLKDIIEHKRFPVYGEMMASDVLFCFIDEYYLCTGLSPKQNMYFISDIDRGLNHYLMGICAAVVKDSSYKINRDNRINLDELNNLMRNTPIKPLEITKLNTGYYLHSKTVPMKLVYQSLRFLQANGIKMISRTFPLRSNVLTQGDNFIWSGYSLEDESMYIKRILLSSINNYKEFVHGNKFLFPQSKFLNPDISLIYQYKPANITTPASTPLLETFIIQNEDRKLPKVTVLIKTDGVSELDTSKHPKIKIFDMEFIAHISSHSSASFFFNELPVLNMIYKMLCEDLEEHYDYR